MIETLLLSCVAIATLDPTRVYEVPASIARRLTPQQRAKAFSCAQRHKIRYRIVSDVRTD